MRTINGVRKGQKCWNNPCFFQLCVIFAWCTFVIITLVEKVTFKYRKSKTMPVNFICFRKPLVNPHWITCTPRRRERRERSKEIIHANDIYRLRHFYTKSAHYKGRGYTFEGKILVEPWKVMASHHTTRKAPVIDGRNCSWIRIPSMIKCHALKLAISNLGYKSHSVTIKEQFYLLGCSHESGICKKFLWCRCITRKRRNAFWKHIIEAHIFN